MNSSTSGRLSASHAASGAKFSKIGAHTGSSRLFRSYANPIVGVCEAARPPMMRAMFSVLRRRISVMQTAAARVAFELLCQSHCLSTSEIQHRIQPPVHADQRRHFSYREKRAVDV